MKIQFENLITPLSDEEFQQLTENIKKYGCRDALVVWDNILLDGHNRLKICKENNIKYRIKEIQLKDKSEAEMWIIKNQFARRNLSDIDRMDLAEKLRDIIAKKAKEKQGERTDIKPTSAECIETDIRVAKIAGVGKTKLKQYHTIKNIITEEQKEKLRKGDITINRTFLDLQKTKRQKEILKNIPKMPTDKYRILMADPPWCYGNSGLDEYGHAERHYPTMKLQEICDMPIQKITEENAVLFLWSTSPLLEDAFKVINAWGFKYKTSFVWDKIKHNFGYYNSVRHEFLLIATKGSCLPDNRKLIDSVQSIERTEHSKKPNEFRKIIDKLYLRGKRIELFARDKVKNWDAYGNQI